MPDRSSIQHRPFQFSLRALLGLMLVTGVAFGVFRQCGLAPRTSLLIGGIIAVSLLCGVALVAALAASVGHDAEDRDNDGA